ncbi:MAG: hypothetical protein HY319_17125 [Armatimonadetes bacterium]|nr:hypothetical protein [Armatimonadota bacterium]
MNPFELSGSPALNGLLEAAGLCYEQGDRDQKEELSRHLSFLTEFRRQVRQQYRESRKLRPRTPLFRETEPRVEKDFERLKEGLRQVRRYLETGDRERLVKGCPVAREAVDSLLAAMDRLRQEEEQFPIYSPSPYIHELAHVALGVVRGEIEPEQLARRLERIRADWKKTRTDLKEWASAPVENDRVAELLPQIVQSMDYLGRGLDRMNAYFPKKNKLSLKEGSEVVLRAADALARLYEELNRAIVPPVPCPRCAAENPPGSRTCEACGAQLPALAGGPISTVDVQSAGAAHPPRFAYIVRVEEAVESFLRGELEQETLQKTVRWFRSRVDAGRRQLKAARPPERFPSPDMEKHARAVRDLMEAAGQLLHEGTELLERFFAEGEREHLSAGLETIRRAESRVAQAQEEMRSAPAG